MIELLLAAAFFLSTPAVHVRATLTGHGHGSFTGSYAVKNGRGAFLWTLVFFDTGRVARADVRVGNGVLFPLCALCRSGQSGRTILTRRGMRLFETGQAAVVLAGAHGEVRGRITTR